MVSDFAVAETSSFVSRLFRTARLDLPSATNLLDDFDLWRKAVTAAVQVTSQDVRIANTMVRQFDLGLRAPDALHLAIARRLDAHLATFDKAMARAASGLGIVLAISIPP